MAHYLAAAFSRMRLGTETKDQPSPFPVSGDLTTINDSAAQSIPKNPEGGPSGHRPTDRTTTVISEEELKGLQRLKSIVQGFQEIKQGVSRVKAAAKQQELSRADWQWECSAIDAWVDYQEKELEKKKATKKYTKSSSGCVVFPRPSKTRVRLQKTQPSVLSSKELKSQTHRVTQDDGAWVEIEYSDCFPKFLELAREVRDIIYEHAMAEHPTRFKVPRVHDFSTLTFYPKMLPGLCFVSKQLMDEGTLTYVRRTRFLIEDGGFNSHKQFMDWLSHFPANTGYDAIRQLGYFGSVTEYCTAHPDDWAAGWNIHRTPCGLISKCTGLRSLVFEFSSSSLVRYTDGRDQLKSYEEVKSEMNFDRLFEMNNLRHLKLYCRAGAHHTTRLSNYWGLGLSHQEIFASLIIILKDGFESRNRLVEVEVVWVEE
ncbi:hypothetical protein BDV96DRAFT_653521 [Lophiotrema nucula]|uniref:Uncharacterized protein n=1 Tax=Lophiotrema nucula TaxID=690887 RepID=A0A6A5YN20_9PLEO|nr:hypothetical protein BDV96DRAFT_653521 [Lophiotrema nucula]